MKKHALILALLALSTIGMAQQSNKSKSKDRYREKDATGQADVREAVDRLGGLRALAESELVSVISVLSSTIQQQDALAPAASRYFAYALLAGHETVARFQTKVSSLQGAVRGMPVPRSFVKADSVFHPFAALWAVLETGHSFFPYSDEISIKQAALEQVFREKGLDEYLIQRSKAAAADISRSILEFASSDGFQQLAPEQMSALRPFFLESETVFALPAPFNSNSNAGNLPLEQARDVYETSQNLSPEQREIAEIWDTPSSLLPGYWLAISVAACSQQKLSFNQALRTHTIVALAMADAYVVCLTDKARYNRVQPQTAINQSLTTEWKPLLETSGKHDFSADYSVVSGAAAEVLTKLVGDQVSVRHEAGGRLRRYTSFRLAAAEAAISRIYGGVQFRDVSEAGLQCGRRIGFFVVQRLPVDQ